MRSIAILAGFAALAADMPIAVHRVPEAHDDDVGTFHHYFDFVFRPSVDMPGPVKQEKSQASIPECSMAARGLGSTTEPYDCQNPDLGRNPEEADQQLNTTPFRSTIEKSNGSLPHKATRAIRSSTNCSLSAITTNHFFRLASAAPVELPDKDSITSQYFQTPTVLAICFVTLLFAVWVSTASRKRWNGCLYVATLGSSIMSIAVLNMGSDAEANQVWVILTSFCLYVAWLRRLSKMTTPRTPEALDIRTTPRPGSAESPEGAVDAENLENPERPDNQSDGFVRVCVGVLGALMGATYALNAFVSSSLDSFPVVTLPFLFPFSIFAVWSGFWTREARPRVVLYVRRMS